MRKRKKALATISLAIVHAISELPSVIKVTDHFVDDVKSSLSLGKRKNYHGIVWIEQENSWLIEISVVLQYGIAIRHSTAQIQQIVTEQTSTYFTKDEIKLNIIVENVAEKE